MVAELLIFILICFVIFLAIMLVIMLATRHSIDKTKYYFCHDFKTNKKYYSDISPHNFTGVIITKFGSKYYYKNDKLHKEDGPAIEYANGDKEYLIYGQYHRLDGPALTYFNSKAQFFIHGQYIKGATHESFKLYIDLMKLKNLI